MKSLLDDAARGLRVLLRNPGFTIATGLMLTVGIGINAAVFAIANTVLREGFRGLDNDRLVYITTPKAVTYPDFQVWRSTAESFRGFAFVRSTFKSLGHATGSPQTYFATEVSAETFRLIGIRPVLGRDFVETDEEPGAPPVVLLRYSLWETRFGADPGVVGTTVTLDGRLTTIIGVMPAGFSFPEDQDLWTPLRLGLLVSQRVPSARYAVGVLRPGITVQHAQVEMELIGRQLASEFPDTNTNAVPSVNTFQQFFVGANGVLFYKLMWASVVFVLLMVCVNVASLVLERMARRSNEMTICAALGASWGRIARQLLVEVSLLSSVGGLGGWVLARVCVALYVSSRPANDVARAFAFDVDYQVLTYIGALMIGSFALISGVSLYFLSKLNLNDSIRAEARSVTGSQHKRRLSSLIVTAEMALAVVLLASTMMTVRLVLSVVRADIGADPTSILSMSLYAPPERYPAAAARVRFFDTLQTELKRLPGVANVAIGTAAPTDLTPRVTYDTADVLVTDSSARPAVAQMVVSDTYLDVLRVAIIRGRGFTSTDTSTSEPVAIINAQFATQHWPNETPIGKRLRLFESTENAGPWLTVVGVVANVVQNDRTRRTFNPIVYVPYLQHSQSNMFVFIRTSVPPATLANAVNGLMFSLDPVMPIPALMPLTERLNRAYAFERHTAVILVVLAMTALLLAVSGIHGTVSSSVTSRTFEIANRIAMGATSSHIWRLVLSTTAVPLVVGLAFGSAGGLLVTQSLRAQLTGVRSVDAESMAIAGAILVMAALAACMRPTARALSIDPAILTRR